MYALTVYDHRGNRRKELSIIVQPGSNFLYRNTQAIYACFTES